MSQHTSSLIAAYDAGLVSKYDVAGPRYTSHPTAPHFTTAFTVAQYENLWQRAQPCIAPLSLYVHVPFCENICYYCACNKIVTRQKEKARQYVNSPAAGSGKTSVRSQPVHGPLPNSSLRTLADAAGARGSPELSRD
jgi:hypothetical protein